MPHDKNGQALQVGDTVLVEAKILDVHDSGVIRIEHVASILNANDVELVRPAAPLEKSA